MKKLLMLGMLMALVSAMTVTVEQSGADPGKIMKGELFTVTASDWDGSCTSANIDFSECAVCSLQNEDAVKSISGSSVSWTSVVASQTASNQKITVSLSGCSPPETATSSGFEVILPPDLSVTVSPASFYNPSGSKQISLTVENTGENSAQDVYASISLPSGVSTGESTTKSLGDIAGEGSTGTAWTVAFSSPSTSTITVTVSSSNAGTVQKTIPVTVPSEEGGGEETPGWVPGGGTTPKYAVNYGSKLQINITYDGTYSFQWNRTLYNISFEAKAGAKLWAEEKSSVANPPEDMLVYKYIEIEEEGSVSDIVLRFAVSRSWLELKGADVENVTIKKYLENGNWKELDVNYVGADTTKYYYEVSLDSLSLFALGIKKPVEEEEKVVQECPPPTEWSKCENDKQTRTIYKLVDGKCVPKVETRKCPKAETVWPSWLPKLVIAFVLLILIAVAYYLFRLRSGGIW